MPIQDHGDDLEVTVLTDKSAYGLSEDVALTLKVRNKASAAIYTYFPTTYRFDFYVYKAGAYLWSHEYGKGHLGIRTNFDIGPASTETFVSAVIWDQTTNTGEAVTSGAFSVTGYLGDPAYNMSSSEPFSLL